jgi:hypothetical protein
MSTYQLHPCRDGYLNTALWAALPSVVMFTGGENFFRDQEEQMANTGFEKVILDIICEYSFLE